MTAKLPEGVPVFIHDDGIDDTADKHFINGTAYTFQQLAELKQEYWDAARKGYYEEGEVQLCREEGRWKYEELSDYEASKKDGQDG